jgi:hypothetical protein
LSLRAQRILERHGFAAPNLPRYPERDAVIPFSVALTAAARSLATVTSSRCSRRGKFNEHPSATEM